MRVLLVETNAQTAQVLARFFEDRDDEVWHAWRLDEAVVLLDLIRPDLMLLDLHFPTDSWLDLLRKAHQENPKLKVIITSKKIDLQREILAKQYGGRVFVRAPFSSQWLEQALKNLEEETPSDGKEESSQVSFKPVHIPVQIKLTLPFLALVLLLLIAGVSIGRVSIRNILQQRFYQQIADQGRSILPVLVQQEEGMLAFLRLAANTQGVALALNSGDVVALETLVGSLSENFKIDTVEMLNSQGVSLFSMRRLPPSQTNQYSFSRGDNTLQQVDFVQKILKGMIDSRGDKFGGVVQVPWGTYFYIAGPVHGAGNRLAGVVLVGSSLESLLTKVRGNDNSEVTIYDPQGNSLMTTLPGGLKVALDQPQIAEFLRLPGHATLTHAISVAGKEYVEVLVPWSVRGDQRIGFVGISKVPVYTADLDSNILFQLFLLVVISVSLVIFIGLYLARLLTGPLKTLAQLAEQVSQGNLDVKMDTRGEDEFAIVGHSFNSMVVGLQESFLFKDFLGRQVSPEVRKQLRHTLETGSVGLAGQDAVVTVLTADIRGFSSFMEKATPIKVFDMLNAYFEKLVPIVGDYGGVVNRYDGDSLLAFFGILPRRMTPQESAGSACQAAVEMLRVLQDFSSQNYENNQPMIAGISVHTGSVIAGGLGTQGKLHYTIVGDTVSAAQRLEVLSRDLFENSGIIISQDTYDVLKEDQVNYSVESLGFYPVKKHANDLKVYRLISFDENDDLGDS